MTFIRLCICLWLLSTTPAAALIADADQLNLQPGVAWLIDPGAGLTINDVQRPDVAARFNTTPSPLSFGFTDAAIWLRWTMRAAPGKSERLLEVFPAWLDHIELYEMTPTGARRRDGGDHAANLGELDYRNPVFRLQLPPQTQTYYLRVTTTSSMFLRLTLWDPQTFAEQTAKESTIQGVLLGIILAMLLYNAVLLLIFRDRITVYYVGHCLFSLLAISTIDGHLAYLLWPYSAFLADRTPGMLVALSIAISSLFILNFLHLEQRFPRMARVFQVLTTFFFCGALAALLGYNRSFAPWVQSCAILAAFLIIALSFSLARQGWRPAYIILAGFTAWIAGAVMTMLRNLGVLEAGLLTNYAVQIGAALEVLLLSLALIERVRQAERDRKLAQESALRLSREAELRLEQQVAERTLELQHSVEQWKTVSAEKGDVLGVVAHDLKNPISVISAIADILRNGAGKMAREESVDWLDRISHSCQRMTTAISQLLELNAMESGISNLSLQQLDVIPLVKELCAEFSTVAAAKEVDLRWELPDQLSAWVDPDGIKQIVDNLLSNAIKYSPSGRSVIVHLRAEGRWVRLEVRDQGPGLTAEDKTRLFGKFVRLSARPTAGESSNGLGLSIVKALVDAMHGEVWCDSEHHHGACFVVRVPSSAEVNQL